MSVLEVKSLCKKYPAFELKDVSFSLEKGKITGFIGRNGAGKSTTLKSLFNFVHPDNGEILFFGNNFLNSEFLTKQRVGFVLGGIDYYTKKKIKVITNITKSFYDKWDNTAYSKYMDMFKLDENKTPAQLSAGMKVKYALTLALSHNAELLILDEPTSGLDPVSRDDLLDVFMGLCDNGITILFSTHITSDLDKCADNIIYIKNGMILADSDIKSFVDSYKVLQLTKDQLTENLQPKLIGCKRSKNGFSALIRTDDISDIGIDYINADLESIMVHLEKEEEK
ncbi:ABC transporter ATP-binding protein [Clostridium autoethanogenum]|uniref:ABC transporter ATP-binding protein n=1 Tax=Clostridium autoethanogenum DSM 10061 TaxID=1341692 RepID=A0ABN4BBH8_9CLOT|nr:ABC transporter ATP-binding protein [Clostridium autoethanogenum]AGY74997.1 ABC transporter ATP-binding protein [Clostridium autoethanogenum DSM 10061]ALU35171.1 AAA-ATPase [Clostridium autoethanogenum DSM 10061]OVY49328.1 ABC transporter ATP-binding protein YtrB [Clostridium autoethanogenum]